MIINNKKVPYHFSYTPDQSLGYKPDVPLCDRELKKLNIKNIFLTLDHKEVKCVMCRRLAPIVLGIKIYPRGTNRGYFNKFNREQQRRNRNSKLDKISNNIPNWKRFKSHKKEEDIKLYAVK